MSILRSRKCPKGRTFHVKVEQKPHGNCHSLLHWLSGGKEAICLCNIIYKLSAEELPVVYA